MQNLRNGSNISSFVSCFSNDRILRYYLNNYSSRANFISIAGVNSLLVCSGIILNITFITTVLKKRALHTVPNVVLLALSITDLLTSLVVIPSQLYSAVLLSQGTIRCGVYLWAYGASGTGLSTSLLFIIVIALEKYLAVCYPFWHEVNVTKLKVFLVCFILAVANIVRFGILFPFNLISVNRMINGFIFVISHVIFFWCQIKIFAVLFKIKRQIRDVQMPSTREFQRRWTNSFALLFICLSFILCYLPGTLYLIFISLFGGSQFMHQYVEPWSFTVAFTTTSISPIVYYWRLKEIRQEAFKLFLKRSL